MWGLPCLRRYRRSGALLPHLFTLTGLASQPIRRYVLCGTGRPRALTPASRTLSGTLPCGVRTFLPRRPPKRSRQLPPGPPARLHSTRNPVRHAGPFGAILFRIPRPTSGIKSLRPHLPRRRNTRAATLATEENRMKIVVLICRILLGLVFLVFGLDKFFHIFPQQPPPPGAAGQFMGALIGTRYIWFVGLCEVIPGILLLINRYVPLALVIVGPVIVNILLVGILMYQMAL